MVRYQKVIFALLTVTFLIVAAMILAYAPAPSQDEVDFRRRFTETLPAGAANAVFTSAPGVALPLPEPGPGDWLSLHDEPGQTFEEFLKTERNIPDSNRGTIYLLPLDSFETPSSQWLSEFVAIYFGMPASLLPPLSGDQRTFTSRTNLSTGQLQWHAGDILEHLKSLLPQDAYCLIGITTVDLYPHESWNFVFGYASYGERVGVFSFARYQPPLDASISGKNRLLMRSAKIMAHEIGHMFGMAHCTAFLCVMNGCNSLAEADRQPIHLCPVCLRKLHRAVGFDLAKRYRLLGEMYGKAGWEQESVWVAAAAMSGR